MDKISIIIVSWNVADPLRKCLQSIFANDYKDLEVIVVDNASSDNSIQVVKSFSKVKLIYNHKNLGFPKSVNQGLKIATGNYFLLLNPDTQLPKDFFTKCLKFTKEYPDFGIMGPKFINPDGTVQGSVFPEPSIINTLKNNFKYAPESLYPIEVNCISGGCMFIPKSTIDRIGYFTERVFMYYEDLDYCRRIRRAGLKVIYNPQIKIIHLHGESSKKSPQAQKYLRQSSIWYNGWLKYTLMTFILWSSQKIHKLKF